ncbi:MAG: hypothetical protein ALECFALPRED_001856 [Alectoria fallacina]|uniref:Uncharacterized protein n=1 Tax=Alectoria fallacina TaxID=1903189 RepID=A0A8H3II30_9LECA|nr:MAG: hypothetical protein ALECFALPRED_001856 [Alectoria fallacina]
MDGPGPSTQANAAARALRAARRASGEVARSAPERQSARFPHRGQRADDGSDEEDESSEDEDDDEDDGEEKAPVYHHEIWKKLLRKGKMGGLLRYVNGEPESGNDPMDITAVERTQMHWNMSDRKHWPKNLTLWKRPTSWNNPTYDIGVMKYKGRVVLDYAGNPIRNFRIPLTISSKVEGLRLESWLRSDDRLTLGDIEARLWTKDAPDGGKIPTFDKRALSKRASNARIRVGLISWASRKGREKQTKFMHDLRTEEQKDRNLATDKDLTAGEMGQYSLIGLDEKKISNAPTREQRIKKIKRTAEMGGRVAGPSDSDDTDGDEAVQEPQIPSQASQDDTDDEGSVSSSLIDPLDSRHDRPMNPQEQAWLRSALEITVGEFSFLTGQDPQPTDPGDNYFSQWGILQEQFRNLWAARGNAAEAPRLTARDRWIGGISQYEFAEVI